MAKIDEKYHELLQHILDNGFKYEDPNRKGIFRHQIPNYQIVHNFSDDFPAITTKQLYWKGVVGELLWFLRGNTNIKYLVDNNIHIWDKDAYNYYKGFAPDEIESIEDFLKGVGVSGYLDGSYTRGNLGRVYGAQWRQWLAYEKHPTVDSVYNVHYIDQISNLIKGLKENPMGTKHMVTAWNPAELNEMALPPCHWSFEILVEPLSISQQPLFKKNNSKKDWTVNNDRPKYQFTLKWHQRSVDTFLGLPFNIASYALLAHIIGKMTNMIPKGIIGDLSNVHIYEPHMDAVKEQLSRDVNKYDSCDLTISTKAQAELLDGLKYIDDGNIEIKDFMLLDYKSYPIIPAEMLAYNK